MAESSTRAAARESPSPPPLPKEPIPTAKDSEVTPADQPIDSLGDDDEEEETTAGNTRESAEHDDDEDDDAEGERPAKKTKGKGKALPSEANSEASGPKEASEAQPWQAVWAPEQNAWYFWHTVTGEVTWTNPLQPPAAESSTEPPPLPLGPPPTRAEDAPRPVVGGIIPDIDPDLAYLLPPDQRGIGPGSSVDAALQTAQFNARSGRFTSGDVAYRFDAMDEFNRQKRFNDHYFDTEAWEKQKAEEHAKRKRDEALGIQRDTKISKKDMDRFRKKKAEQKYRKQAWLRD